MRYVLLSLFILAALIPTSHAAWFDANSGAKTNLTIENIVGTAVPNAIFNVTWNEALSITQSCNDTTFVNQTENGILEYHMENNTCGIGNTWWATTPTANTGNDTYWMYHNWTPSNPYNETQYFSNQNGLIYWMHLSENQAPQWNSMPNKNSSTLPNADSVAGGRFGRGVQLYGNSTAPSGVIIPGGWGTAQGFNDENITIEFWVNPSDTNSRAGFGYTSAGCELAINPSQSGPGEFRFVAIDTVVIFDNIGGGASPYTAGNWYHYAFSYDGHVARIYKNGTLIESYSGSGGLCMTADDLALGSGGSGGLSGMIGFVDELRVWARNLSADEIASSAGQVRSIIGATETAPADVNILEPENITYTTQNRTLAAEAGFAADSWWYILNGGSNVSFTPNTTFLAAAGLNELEVYANDSAGVIESDVVNFSWQMTINISAFLPNGSAVATFNTTISNVTSSIQINDSSDVLTVYSMSIPQGNVTFNVTSVGHDNEIWNLIVNNTNIYAQHNFTLYPLSYVNFRDSVFNQPITGWRVLSAASGINSSVSAEFSVSNRNLTAGVNTFIASKEGYITNSTDVTVDTSISFNVTINTTINVVTIETRDEITQVNIPFNMNLYLKNDNTTLRTMTAMRAGLVCFYDEAESTTCVRLTGPSGEACVNTSTIQAQDYTNATFVQHYEFTKGAGTDWNRLTVYIGSEVVYNNASGIAGAALTRTVWINNSNATYPRAINLTVETCSVQTSTSYYDTKEFRMTANDAGYTYVEDFIITFPLLNYTGFTTYDAWFTGEETYNPDYSVARMFRFSISTGSDFDVVAYLINNSLSTVYTQFFNILDGNNVPIPEALMTLQKWIGGIRVTVAQCEANVAGACYFPLQRAVEYAVIVVANGFETFERENTVFTGLPNPQNVFLDPSGTSNFTSVYDNLVIAIEPNDEYQTSSFNTTCTIAAADGNVNWINFTLEKFVNNTFQFNASNYTNSAPSGGAIRFEIIDTGRYRVQCEFQWVSNATGTSITYQDFYSQSYWIYNDLLQDAAPGLIHPLLGMLFVIGAIILICVPLSRIDVTLATGAAIIIMLIGGFTGFVGWDVAALSIMTAASFIILRRSP